MYMMCLMGWAVYLGVWVSLDVYGVRVACLPWWLLRSEDTFGVFSVEEFYSSEMGSQGCWHLHAWVQ